MLSLFDHGVSRTRHTAGLGRPQLRFTVPPDLPEVLAVRVASRLRSVADAAGVDVTWLEFPLDAGFPAILEHRADSGVGWLDPAKPELPDPLDLMRIGSFEPVAWIRASHPAARRGRVTLGELTAMNVVHGPRRACPATYDAWLAMLQAVRPGFAFSDPPLQRCAAGDHRVRRVSRPADRGADRTASSPAGWRPATVARSRRTSRTRGEGCRRWNPSSSKVSR